MQCVITSHTKANTASNRRCQMESALQPPDRVRMPLGAIFRALFIQCMLSACLSFPSLQIMYFIFCSDVWPALVAFTGVPGFLVAVCDYITHQGQPHQQPPVPSGKRSATSRPRACATVCYFSRFFDPMHALSINVFPLAPNHGFHIL